MWLAFLVCAVVVRFDIITQSILVAFHFALPVGQLCLPALAFVHYVAYKREIFGKLHVHIRSYIKLKLIAEH